MPDRIRWITDDESLERELRAIGTGPLALDTEADSLHHYPEKVCLIQLSFGEHDLLLDPLAGVDVRLLAPVLADPAVPKILHGADYDLRVLSRDFGLEIRGLFDTMIASRLVGERAFGLGALLEGYLGVHTDKRFQRADWSQRPLSIEMQAYAINDTRHLRELAAALERRLDEVGRGAWAREEFERLERVRWRESDEDPEAFRRVKRTGDLGALQLAALRELHTLREAEARRRDRPPFKIMRDEVLADLARAMPASVGTLAEVRGLPRGYATGTGAARLLDAIRRAQALPRESWPEPRKGGRPRPDPAFENRVRELARRRDEIAERLGLEPSVVAPKGLLAALQSAREQGRPFEELPDLRRWQAELLIPAFFGPAGSGHVHGGGRDVP